MPGATIPTREATNIVLQTLGQQVVTASLQVITLVAVVAAMGSWIHAGELHRQWVCYWLGCAQDYEDFCQRVAWFDPATPNDDALRASRLGTCDRVGQGSVGRTKEWTAKTLQDFDGQVCERAWTLVEKWGTGNQQFDLYLARYLRDPACSDRLRKMFSLELAWRPEQLSRLSHLRRWEISGSPADHFDRLADQLHSRHSLLTIRHGTQEDFSTSEFEQLCRLTWADILEVQVLFEATGHAHLAHRLTPENWPQRYQRWVEVGGRDRHFWNIPRPSRPFLR